MTSSHVVKTQAEKRCFNVIRRLYDASGGIGVLGNGDKNMVI